MSRDQDGWLWSLSDDDWEHAESACEAIADGVGALEDSEESAGVITICPAYRVDPSPLGAMLAEQAIEWLSDGTIETCWTDYTPRIDAVEAALAEAFAASVREHVGPWWETLPGEVRVGVTIAPNGPILDWSGTRDELVERVRAEWEES